MKKTRIFSEISHAGVDGIIVLACDKIDEIKKKKGKIISPVQFIQEPSGHWRYFITAEVIVY